MPWIHVEDVIGIYLAAIDDDRWSGPVNATAPAAGDQPRVLQGARPRAAPPGDRAGARRSRSASSTAAWPSSCSRARTPSPAAPSSSATATGTRTSTRRCAQRSQTLDHRPGGTGKVPQVTREQPGSLRAAPRPARDPGFLSARSRRAPASRPPSPPRSCSPPSPSRSSSASRRSPSPRTSARPPRPASRARAPAPGAPPSCRPSCACARAAAQPARGLTGAAGDRGPPGAGRRPRDAVHADALRRVQSGEFTQSVDARRVRALPARRPRRGPGARPRQRDRPLLVPGHHRRRAAQVETNRPAASAIPTARWCTSTPAASATARSAAAPARAR